MRPIDADALIETIKNERFSGWGNCCVEIDNAPTVDAVPVKHGRWKEVDDGWDGVYYECSECGLSWALNDGTPEENEMCYCPKCGARMDERLEDDDDSEV